MWIDFKDKMKCVGLAFALVFLYGVTAQFDDRLIQTLEDAVENSTISESCQEALGLYFENLLSTTDMWALRSKCFLCYNTFLWKAKNCKWDVFLYVI